MSSGSKLNGSDDLSMELASKSLHEGREKAIVEVICRVTGRTDHEVEEAHALYKDRGEFRVYADNTAVFAFDGEDCLLFGEPYQLKSGEWVQKIERLYDRQDYVHHTKEDESG